MTEAVGITHRSEGSPQGNGDPGHDSILHSFTYVMVSYVSVWLGQGTQMFVKYYSKCFSVFLGEINI